MTVERARAVAFKGDQQAWIIKFEGVDTREQVGRGTAALGGGMCYIIATDPGARHTLHRLLALLVHVLCWRDQPQVPHATQWPQAGMPVFDTRMPDATSVCLALPPPG